MPQRSQVEAHRVPLTSQGCLEVDPEIDQRRSHHLVRDDLGVVRSEEEEEDPRGQADVPVLLGKKKVKTSNLHVFFAGGGENSPSWPRCRGTASD